jgi:hypothetical protein
MPEDVQIDLSVFKVGCVDWEVSTEEVCTPKFVVPQHSFYTANLLIEERV